MAGKKKDRPSGFYLRKFSAEVFKHARIIKTRLDISWMSRSRDKKLRDLGNRCYKLIRLKKIALPELEKLYHDVSTLNEQIDLREKELRAIILEDDYPEAKLLKSPEAPKTAPLAACEEMLPAPPPSPPDPVAAVPESAAELPAPAVNAGEVAVAETTALAVPPELHDPAIPGVSNEMSPPEQAEIPTLLLTPEALPVTIADLPTTGCEEQPLDLLTESPPAAPISLEVPNADPPAAADVRPETMSPLEIQAAPSVVAEPVEEPATSPPASADPASVNPEQPESPAADSVVPLRDAAVSAAVVETAVDTVEVEAAVGALAPAGEKDLLLLTEQTVETEEITLTNDEVSEPAIAPTTPSANASPLSPSSPNPQKAGSQQQKSSGGQKKSKKKHRR